MRDTLKKYFGNKQNFCIFGILILFTVLCLVRILPGDELNGDEFFSLEDSYGRAFHGVAERWDFVTDSGIGEPLGTLKKLNPYFGMLGLWMRIFGVTETSMRLLSMLWGITAVVSIYWVTKKRTTNALWGYANAIVLALCPWFISMSTIVREYTMLTCLNIWIFYFAYKALNAEKFDWKSIVPAFILACAAFCIRIFEVIYLLGIGVYIIYKAIRTRKKQFLILAVLEAAGVLFLVPVLAIHPDKSVPLLGTIVEFWDEFALFGLRNGSYWINVLKIIFWPVSALSLGILFFSVLFNKEESDVKSDVDIVVFMLCIVVATLTVFTTLVNWPESPRYTLAVYPAAIFVLTSGFFISNHSSDIVKYFLYGILCCCIAINLLSVWPRTFRRDASKPYSKAYTELAEHAGDEPFFITGIRLRGYYANDILPDYTWRALTSKVDEDSNISHLEELCDIGIQNPEGYLYCETERNYHLRNGFWNFLNMDSFEKITGDGIDDTGINTWAYQLVYPSEGEIAPGEGKTVLFGYNFGAVSRITEEEGRTILELQINGDMPSKMLLSVKLNQYHDGECTKRYTQLVLLPHYGEKQYYQIIFDNSRAVNRSELDHTYSFYDGEEPEYYEDCYSLEE